jgi:hypothetical protein
LRFQSAEQFLADRFVTSFGEPTAALVAASDMKAEGHAGKSFHHRIVQLDPPTEPTVQVPA